MKGAALPSLLLLLPRAQESRRFQWPGGAGVPDVGGLPEPGSEGTRTGTRVREAPSPLFLARPTVALSDPPPNLGHSVDLVGVCLVFFQLGVCICLVP